MGAAIAVASDVAAAIAAVEQDLHWKQNPNYSDGVMGQRGYMDGYAYAEIVGPSGFFAGDDFLLGLLILGPGRVYLDHHHAAPELYWTLTGPSRVEERPRRLDGARCRIAVLARSVRGACDGDGDDAAAGGLGLGARRGLNRPG